VFVVAKIEEDFQRALKSQDKSMVDTLRLLKAELLKKEKEGKGLTEEMALQVLRIQQKQRQESMTEYTKAERNDLASKEAEELEIIKKYLPAQLSEEKVKEIIGQVVNKLSEVEKGNFGKVMSGTMAALEGRAEGQVVSRLVKEHLSSKI